MLYGARHLTSKNHLLSKTSVDIRIDAVPVFDGRQYTHFYHLVTKCAEMGIAFFQFGFFFGRAVQFLIVYTVFGNFSFHCHHDVVEAMTVYIRTCRPGKHSELLNTPLDRLGFSRRVIKACRELGFFTTEHLLMHLKRYRLTRLYCVRNFGAQSGTEILRWLHRNELIDDGSPRDFQVLFP